MSWQKVRTKIPKNLNKTQRERFGTELLRFVRNRTQKKSLDKNDQKFPGYSKQYIKSLDFKNAGKSKSKVDITLTGDTLASMKVLSHREGSMLWGFDNGTAENDKAEGNIKGTYGQKSPIKGKKRDFLGVKQKDVNAMARLKRVKGGDNGD